LSIVTLTTDFGWHDSYVGAMKGVILGIAPDATLVDISHDITPQHIQEAAFVVFTAYRYFPRDTVHLVVIDPGVGTARRPMALQTSHGLFVAPDNGVLGYVLSQEPSSTAVHLTEERYWLPQISHTFHGRDIFAPVAAHLACGVRFESLGVCLPDPIMHEIPDARCTDAGRIQAVALHIDRFGNVVTNLPANMWIDGTPIIDLGSRLSARVAGHTIQGLKMAYGDVQEGEYLLLVGSSGFVEIARCAGNAAEALDLHVGDAITFEITASFPGMRSEEAESKPAREG
jgi:S-adenosyl-L-methionine hydrolase (adenosine-forming)